MGFVPLQIGNGQDNTELALSIAKRGPLYLAELIQANYEGRDGDGAKENTTVDTPRATFLCARLKSGTNQSQMGVLDNATKGT